MVDVVWDVRGVWGDPGVVVVAHPPPQPLGPPTPPYMVPERRTKDGATSARNPKLIQNHPHMRNIFHFAARTMDLLQSWAEHFRPLLSDDQFNTCDDLLMQCAKGGMELVADLFTQMMLLRQNKRSRRSLSSLQVCYTNVPRLRTFSWFVWCADFVVGTV